MTVSELAVLAAAGALALLGIALANARAAVVVTMSLAALTMTWNNIRLGILTLSDLLLLATIGLLLVSPMPIPPVSKLFGGSQRSIVAYATLLLVGGLVGGVLRQQPDLGLGIGLRFAASVAAIVFLVSALVRRREDFERYAVWYVVGAALNGLVAIAGADEIAGRPIGLTNHPNHLGLAMVLATFLGIAALGSRSRLVSTVAAVCLAPIIAATVVSGSRGAILAYSVGLLVLILMRRGRAAPWLSGLALALVVLAFILPKSLRSGTSALGRLISPTDYDDAATAGRLVLYQEASELIRANPVFGEGFARALVFHSVPLQALVMGGLIGFVALLFLLRGGVKAVRYATAPGRPIAERACGAGLTATAVFLLVAPNLFDRYFIFFVSITFMVCSTQIAQLDASAQPASNENTRAAHPV